MAKDRKTIRLLKVVLICAIFAVTYGLLLQNTSHLPELGSPERFENRLIVQTLAYLLFALMVAGILAFLPFFRKAPNHWVDSARLAESLDIQFPLTLIDFQSSVGEVGSFATLEDIGHKLVWMNAGDLFSRDHEAQFLVLDARKRPLWLKIENGNVTEARWT